MLSSTTFSPLAADFLRPRSTPHHYGLFASGAKADDLTTARDLLAAPAPAEADASEGETRAKRRTCPSCGGRMHIIEVFNRGETPRNRPSPAPARIRIDTS